MLGLEEEEEEEEDDDEEEEDEVMLNTPGHRSLGKAVFE
jgi:hypothetical protein